MSDTPGGPDWYQASDGKWYPSQPAQAPYGQSPSTPPPGPSIPPPPSGYEAPSGPAYQPPLPGAYPGSPQTPKNGLATAAMILGIIALVTSWLCGLGILVGIAAIVLGILGMSSAKKLPGQPLRGRALAGLIMGIVAVALSVVFVVAFTFIGGDSTSDFDINTDTPNGVCDQDRFLQDPDC